MTSVRRVGARRPAGPPATTTASAAPPTETTAATDATEPTATVDGAGGETIGEAVDDAPVETDEAVHVPVKKKGSRKR